MDTSPSSSLQSPCSAMAAKIFVGGITKELEENVLKEYFEKYGDVKEVVILRDRVTGDLKGYGFVEFIDSEAADRAIKEQGQHLVLNKPVDVKRAKSRLEERRSSQSPCHRSPDHSAGNSYNKGNNITSRKIFVGGLSANVTGDELRSYFEKFGSVNDFVIMYDRETHRPRGFGFITFDLEEAAQNAVQMRFHELNKKRVEVKIAIPRASHDHTGNIYNRRISNSSNYLEMLNSSIKYQPWVYPSYDPKYGYYYSHASPLVPGYGFRALDYGGGYSYSATDNGTPYVCPSFTWNELTIRQIPVPYSDASFYAGYANTMPGGYMKIANGGYHGAVWFGKGKLNQASYLKTTEPEPVSKKISLEAESVAVDNAQ